MSNVKITYAGPKSEKISTQADIVFCVDSTGSMEPCIEGVKNGIATLVEGLKTSAEVDFRLRLIAYRDRHDARCGTPWDIYPFTSSADLFRSQVECIKADGGGDAPESTLDALFIALRSEWRTSGTHKTIVLLTDADTHPTLHPSTYKLPDNGVHRIIQEFQTLRHAMLFMVAPRYPTYLQIERSIKDADRQVIANYQPVATTIEEAERLKGLKNVAWEPLMNMIGKTVSVTSVAVAHANG